MTFRLPVPRHAATLVATLVATVALPAGAADIVTKIQDYGVLNTPTALGYTSTFLDADPLTAGIQLASVGTLLPTDRFYEDYAFTIGDADFSTLAATIDLGSVLGISNLQVRLYQGTPQSSTGLVQAWSNASLIASGNTGNVTVISPVTLGPGSYVLEVRGNITGSSGGAYAGVMNLSPVPEPGAVAMLLAGLGVIGFVARRRA